MRNYQGYVVIYVFFDPAVESKGLIVQEPKILEMVFSCVTVKVGIVFPDPESRFMKKRKELIG